MFAYGQVLFFFFIAGEDVSFAARPETVQVRLV
jgi:hypothetical protein